MTQMYGKFALILTLAGLLISLVNAQAGEPIPVLLNTQNEAERQAWQDALTAAFDDQTLIWVEAEKDADIVMTQEGQTVGLFVRQNALQRLSPILEPAPSLTMELEPIDSDFALGVASLWQLAQGDCYITEYQADSLDLWIEGSTYAHAYRQNCRLIDSYKEGKTPSEYWLTFLGEQFGNGIWIPAAKVNWLWIQHQKDHNERWLDVINLQVINSQMRKEWAFWYAKRAQFYALDFDYQAALRDLDVAIRQDPENPLYLILRGEVYLLLYEWNNAKDAFDAAIALDPEFALAYFQRGILLSTMTDTEGANADFSMYLSLEPRGVYAEMARQYMVGG